MRILRPLHRRDREAAIKAREAAERDLERTKAETEDYRELGETLRKMRERNHFADAIGRTFREGRA